jgi:hypothetical protein
MNKATTDHEFMRGVKAGFILAGQHPLSNEELLMVMATRLFPTVGEKLGLKIPAPKFQSVLDQGDNGSKPKKVMSVKGRARIAKAQRARWAKFHEQKKKVARR